MATIANYFEQGQLSLGSYAPNLQRGAFGSQNTDYVTALKFAGMSQKQAEVFADTYSVVDQFSDALTSFSATVFDRGGVKYFAIRGTEGFTFSGAQDWLANVLDVSAEGIAVRQGLALFNYLQRLEGAAGNPVVQYFYDLLTRTIGTTTATANGLLSGQGSLSVTGHSLGGHLAMMMSRLAPGLVSSAYTYNAPGFDVFNSGLTSEGFFSLLRNAPIGPITGAIGTAWDSSIMTHWNVQGDVVHDIGDTPGSQGIIFSENANQGVVDAHDIKAIADSLALYQLFSQIGPQIGATGEMQTIAAISRTLEAEASNPSMSLEAALDSLRRLLKDPNGPALIATTIGNRDQFYQNLYDPGFQQRIAAYAGQLSFSRLTDIAATDLSNLAQGSTAFAYRYALRELNPFAILGNNDLYAPHNQNGELNLYDPVNRTGTLTAEWIADRAAFLAWKNQYFTTDGVTLRSTRDENYVFENRDSTGKTDLSLTVVGNLAFGGNGGAALNPAKVVFGNTGTDAITGGILSDRLYGEAGTDWLEGKGHNDYLEGGLGLDIYNYNALRGLFGISGNDGADVIRDTDGKGVLRYVFNDNGTLNSTVIADASVRVSGLQWNSADGRFTYIRSQEDLIITINGEAGGSITLKDFRDGDFNIHLWEARANPEITGATITGDLQPQDFDPNTEGIQTQTDALGNVIVTANAEPDRADMLFDSAGNDRIIAGGGNDTLRGIRGGDDWMSGDAGRDNLGGGAGADLLEGGADGVFGGESGGDIAYGDLGNDELYADTKISLAEAIIQGNTGTASNAKGDYLSGGGGEDWIVGAAGEDYLDGGSGQDLIVGGAGSDNIGGDFGFVAISPLWVVAREVTPQDNLTLYTLNFVSGSVSGLDGGAGAADVIYAGAGIDWVFAGDGNDYMDAGPDGDVAFGMTGDDVLIGGDGNDILVGDSGPGGTNDGGDYLDGGDGNDYLQGDGGNDVLIGGVGNDTLSGAAGKDIYVFNRGDGTDTVFDTDTGSNSPDASVLVLGDGVDRSDIKFKPGSLAVDIGPSDSADPNSPHDVIHFDGFDQLDPTATTPLGEIRCADGTSMSYADILAQGFDIDGTEGNDNGQTGEPPMLVGTGIIDRIRGLGGNDVLFGLAGDDVLDGGDGADQLIGGPGVDTIYGGAGDDQISADGESGGAVAPDGSDVVYGGGGNDIVYGFDGADQIFGDDGGDALYGDFGGDIVEGGAGDDGLYGQGYFFSEGIPYLNFFDDGASDTLRGGDGNDYLNSAAGDDVLEGGAGDDNLEGEAGADYIAGQDGNDLLWGDKAGSPVTDQGNDTLDGGADNDQLVGYAGNDTYVFGRGYGQDTVFDQDATAGNIDRVEFATDISPDDVTAMQSGASLVLTISGTTDALTIANQFVSTADRVEEIRFADGTVWDPNSIPFVIRGTAGNDILTGTAGADMFEGLAGNDTMSGGAGNDTYRIFRGDGQDVITDSDSTVGNVDKIVYAADVLPSDVQARRSGNNLVLALTGTTDQVTVTNYFQNDGVTPNSIEQIKFLTDGTVWDVNTVKQMVLTGTAGADVITGYATNDVLSGLGGNDTLTGNAGHDTLDGGTGNDLLQGGTGNDAYLIVRGGGQDTITDVDSTAGNVDRIVYAADIAPSEVQVTRSGDNLVLKLAGTTDQVTVINYFQNDGANTSLVEQIQFLADGATWDVNTVKLLALTGADGNDSITGYVTDDVLNGLGGNDTLTGNAGHDTLDGGTGNDLLQGGTGNDACLIVRGGGQDTITDIDATAGNVDKIVYAADVLPSEVQAARSGNNLVLKLAGTTDQVTVTNYFQNDGANTSLVEQIQFLADGTIWDLDTVKSMAVTPTSGDDAITGYATDDTLSGLGGNDVIHGAGGNDTLDGGAGNDTLFGESGSDTYLFARGDGQDVIDNAASDGGGTTDALSFAADILPSDITPTRGGSDLILSLQGSTDQVRIQNYFLSGQNVVEEIRFADGTVWTEQTILTFLPLPPVVGTEGNDIIQGSAASELIRALGGDDTILGGGGNDTFEGGAGEDTLVGSTGNDTYLFNIGDGGPGGFFITGDDISDAGGYDVLQFGPGITPSGVRVLDGGSGFNRYLVLSPQETPGGVYILGYFSTGHVEEIRFQDGTVWTDEDIAPLVPIWGGGGDDSIIGTGIADVIYGSSGNDVIFGSAGNDDLYGHDGNDQLYGQLGNDELYGDVGNDLLDGGDGNDLLDAGLGSDTLYGQAGNDVLIAGAGESKNAKVSNVLYGGTGDDVLVSSGKTDKLYGEEGNDILLGAAQGDLLEDTGGNNLLFAAAAVDDVRMGDQNDLVIGGTGNDLLDGDGDADGVRGRDILVFNKSDGVDSVSRLGSGSTISIGGGTLYSNLSFEVVGTTLRLKTASSHYISLTDWYASPANKSVSTLQIVIEGTRDYKPTSTNLMNNKKIQAFDFLGLIAAFDAAGHPSNFNVASNLANYRLWSSDTDAIGGAVAYQYARTGSTGTLSYDQMRAVIGDPAFVVSAQPIAAPVVAAALDAGTAVDASADTFAAATLAADTTTATSDVSRMAADFGTIADQMVQVDSIALETDTQSVEEDTTPPIPDFLDLPDVAIEHLPILPDHVAPRIPLELLTPPTPILTSFLSSPPGAQIASTQAAHAFGGTPQSARATESRPAPHNTLVDDTPTGSGVSDIQGDAVHAAGASTSNAVDGTLSETDSLIEQWFARHSLNDDLTLLDEIARGEGAENSSASDVEIAAAWQRSHHWLNRLLDANNGTGDDGSDGADLAGVRFFDTGNGLAGMPQAAVGLRNVAGHDLKPFSGLREGVSVLAQ